MDGPTIYLSLGDSMSIDVYPYEDVSASRPGIRRNIGASALLYCNESDLWPEFQGRDFVSHFPSMSFFNLAEDGALTFHFMDTEYLELIQTHLNEAVVVTLTIGGNDLLDLVGPPGLKEQRAKAELDEKIESLKSRFDRVVDIICTKIPRSILILNSVFDPSDGTGRLSEFIDYSDKLQYLDLFNKHVAETARKRRAMFADVHAHFLGHGLSAPEPERWYWRQSPIEPSARGASEIRRLWVDLLISHGILRKSSGLQVS